MWTPGDAPRLSFVLGKGGVGKSTLSAALAMAAHQEGARVLAVEVGEATGLGRVLGVALDPPLEAKRSPLGVTAVRFEGAAALAEYLTRVMHLGRLLRKVFAHPLYRAFVEAAPGVKELMVAGKIRAELLFEKEGARSRWDWIVVDAGASGHALELLQTPLVMVDTFAPGRVRRESTGIRDLYSDPGRTAIHVVATPEEMPVAEAIATVSRLRALGLPLGTIFVNRCRPPVPAGTEEALARLAAFAPDDAGVTTAARHELGWVRLQEREIRRLAQETGLRLLDLPRISPGPLGEAELLRLAGLLREGFQPALTPLPLVATLSRSAGEGSEWAAAIGEATPALARNAGEGRDQRERGEGRLGALLDAHRLIVCVGTGGVGKTTVAAALAIDGARQGRRALVLTIDPARALARAFGFERLSSTGERIDPALLAASGTLDAAMLDPRQAWDELVVRYSPSRVIRDAILRNRFYQEFSQRFPGSTEYVAMEEVARLHASGRYDLIVLDTPPAEHALDFVRAPARLTHLLTRQVEAWARHPVAPGGARRLLVRLMKAVGGRTFQDVIDFFASAGSLIGSVRERSEAAQALLRSPDAAFVLITSAAGPLLAAAAELSATLAAEGITLKGAVANRAHPLPGEAEPDLAAAGASDLLRQLDAPPDVTEWLRKTHREALAAAVEERRQWAAFQAAAPEVSAWTAIPELDHDVCSLADLRWLAGRLREQEDGGGTRIRTGE